MRSRADVNEPVAPLRLVVGLVRFGLALIRTLVALARETGGSPDPITLEPRVLTERERSDDAA